MEKIMAVLTGERNYGERLCAYANFKRDMPFTAVSFDSIEAYGNFAGKHKIGVLLTDGHLESRWDFRESGLGNEEMVIGLFDESDENSIFNNIDGPGIDTYTLIPKYQSAEKIMRSVMSCCNVLGCHLGDVSAAKDTSIISIYSPISSYGKSAYALTLAKVISAKTKTLFINLEEFSGFGMVTGENYEVCVSDAILALKQGRLDYEKICSLVHIYCGIEYIPPVRYAEDMKGMTGEDHAGLIAAILKNSAYETVVVELPSSFNLAEELLEISDEIFMPEDSDVMSRAKGDELMAYLEFSKKLKLKSKFSRFTLPIDPLQGSKGIYMEDLLYRELGDIARSHARIMA